MFGTVVLRGTISEIGTERVESVSLAGAQLSQQLGRGCLAMPFRAAGVLLGLLFAPLRMLLFAGLMGGGGRRPDGPDSLQIPTTPFVLTEDGGAEYDCIIRGEVRGGFLKLGESVVIGGRIDRSRVVRVERLESRRTGAITKGWVDPRARAAKVRTIAGIVMIVGLLLIVLSLGGMFST